MEICRLLPVVKKIIEKYGSVSLSHYINNFSIDRQPGFQSGSDLNKAVFQYTTPLLGKSVAKRVAHDISNSPSVLTTTHHGIDYFANSVQGNLIYGAGALTGRSSQSTIPVFSWGNIPLNNATYSRGILIYLANYPSLQEMPLKLPLYPDKCKNTMVSYTQAFDLKMIAALKQRIYQLFKKNILLPSTLDILNTVLDEDYSDPDVISLQSYSEQSVIVNHRIWKRLFSNKTDIPDLIYIEMETIVNTLLQTDLANAGSLARRVLFNPSVKQDLLRALDGVRGCWNQKNLIEQQNRIRKKTQTGTGTVFFWGVDPRGRRIPLHSETNSKGQEFLCGIKSNGDLFTIPYHIEAIMQGLYEKTILPSLFTCFLTVSFARGLVCIGGDFQGEYLSKMQTGLTRSLKKSGDEDLADCIKNVKTDAYLDGMLAFMCPLKKTSFIPAGPIEIISSGGVAKSDIEQALLLTVREAHMAGLFETLEDSKADLSKEPEWKLTLAEDCYRLLNEKIMITDPG